MKRLICFLSLFLLLSGCGQREVPAEEAVPEIQEESCQGEETSAENPRAAYVAALRRLMEDHVLPDGTDVSGDFAPESNDPVTLSDRDMSQNRFAVLDVDGDGQEELLLLYTTSSSAGSVGLVVNWDESTGALRTTLSPYPSGTELVFYSNGAVREGWSHNQGRGGRFWPFNLYVYDAETDSYRQVGAVDAWDSQVPVENFPREIDTGNSGIVYYIYEDLNTQWGQIPPVEESVYLDWLNESLKGAEPLDILWNPLTAEHIENLI